MSLARTCAMRSSTRPPTSPAASRFPASARARCRRRCCAPGSAASGRIRPVAQPEYDYDLPSSEDDEWSFTATVDVQPKPEVADWTTLEVPYYEAEVPSEVVDEEIDALRESVADLAPVDGRAAQTGDVVVVDAVEESGETQRDLVLELGSGRLLEEVERALIGASPGDTRSVEYRLPDGQSRTTNVTVKE